MGQSILQSITVYLNRTNVVAVDLGIDVSLDAFTSQIRRDEDVASTIIATWTVTFKTDGTDGELILTLDNSLLTSVNVDVGYMDIKRVTGGEPIAVFEKPLKVLFQKSVTT